MRRDYRWRLHMLKAALDQYLQLKLRDDSDKERRVRSVLGDLKPGQCDATIAQAIGILREPAETTEMKRLRDEAGKLGDETNQLRGDRNLGYFKLDTPLRNISGAIDLLEEARSAKSDEDRKSALQSVIDITNKRTTGGRRG